MFTSVRDAPDVSRGNRFVRARRPVDVVHLIVELSHVLCRSRRLLDLRRGRELRKEAIRASSEDEEEKCRCLHDFRGGCSSSRVVESRQFRGRFLSYSRAPHPLRSTSKASSGALDCTPSVGHMIRNMIIYNFREGKGTRGTPQAQRNGARSYFTHTPLSTWCVVMSYPAIM